MFLRYLFCILSSIFGTFEFHLVSWLIFLCSAVCLCSLRILPCVFSNPFKIYLMYLAFLLYFTFASSLFRLFFTLRYRHLFCILPFVFDTSFIFYFVSLELLLFFTLFLSSFLYFILCVCILTDRVTQEPKTNELQMSCHGRA